MVQGAVGLRYLVSLDPFSAVLLGNSNLDSIFVNALDDASITLQWATTDRDRLTHLQVFLFCPKSWLHVWLHSFPACGLQVPSHDCAVISLFDNNTISFIKLRIEQEKVVSVGMLNLASGALNKEVVTS